MVDNGCLVESWTWSWSTSEILVEHQHTSMRNKQNKHQALVSSQSYDFFGVSKTWWNKCHTWQAGMEGCRLSRRDGQGRQCGGAALYEKERSDCTALTVSDDMRETLVSRERCSVCYQQALRRNLWVGILFLLEIATLQTSTVNTVLLWHANLGNVWSS